MYEEREVLKKMRDKEDRWVRRREVRGDEYRWGYIERERNKVQVQKKRNEERDNGKGCKGEGAKVSESDGELYIV